MKINKNNKILILFCTIILLVLVQLISVNTHVFAAGDDSTRPTAPEQIPNPLGTGDEASDPRLLLGRIISAVLGIVGSLALAIFIYGGFTWMTSAGNQDRVKKGKDMIIWAVLGLAIIFTSYAIISFLIGAFIGDGEKTQTQGYQDLARFS